MLGSVPFLTRLCGIRGPGPRYGSESRYYLMSVYRDFPAS
jgi:hypothetical protein